MALAMSSAVFPVLTVLGLQAGWAEELAGAGWALNAQVDRERGALTGRVAAALLTGSTGAGCRIYPCPLWHTLVSVHSSSRGLSLALG